MENVLREHKRQIDEFLIIPSSGGAFEITLNGELLFSKKKLDRFPDEEEAEDLIRDHLVEKIEDNSINFK